jgi:hypothetical protein
MNPEPPAGASAAGNSRASVAAAGWNCPSNGFEQRIPAGRRRHPFSWLNPVPLWQSRNDRLVRRLGDPTNDQRRRWVGTLAAGALRIDRTDLDRPRFLVLGDTGEGDGSQWATVPLLERLGSASDFMVIASDVIYPAGGITDYDEKFYKPYKNYSAPIYAVPGNHDWYDGLTGFMFHLCRRERQPAAPRPPLLSKARLRDLLSRKPRIPSTGTVERMRDLRDARHAASQPAPYFLLDTGPLQLVGIDTGITGSVDRDQAAWLRRVSAASEKPKILITGKPIYVDGQHHPGAIEDGGTVDEIVRAREHNYVAAIGGDIHNYQRYPVDVGGGRIIQYLVNGGGGAFMHATHKIGRVDLDGVSEAAFRCYPLRGDSLSFYSQLYDAKLAFGRGKLFIPPDQAAAIMAERLGIEPSKPDARAIAITGAARKAAARVFPLPGRAHGPLQAVFSEFFDWNDPPLFKSLLEATASAEQLTITCHAATGCIGDGTRPPEDQLIATQAEGRWTWHPATR